MVATVVKVVVPVVKQQAAAAKKKKQQAQAKAVAKAVATKNPLVMAATVATIAAANAVNQMLPQVQKRLAEERKFVELECAGNSGYVPTSPFSRYAMEVDGPGPAGGAWFYDGLEQIILGKRSGKNTVVGATGSVALEFTGLDILKDISDLGYDLDHQEDITTGELALDAIALIPVIGAIKNVKHLDDAIDAARSLEKAATAAKTGTNLVNGMKVSSSKALDMTEEFLGAGYKEISPEVFRSQDGLRQVRMTDSDLAVINNHAGAAHLNFETGTSIVKPNGKTTFSVSDNIHVYIVD